MDLLFSQIESWHNIQSWGSVLDAGTGRHSLKWLSGLPTQRWTAVTGDINRATALQLEFKKQTRAFDRICHGNWIDDNLLQNEVFDVVIADYLLGAIDGFAPYYQRKLFARLKRHVGQRLYVVGQEPLPVSTPDPGGALIVKMANLRDAHIRLAAHRCYREYPIRWVKDVLIESGYEILHQASFPIRYNQKAVNGQLRVCDQKLQFIQNSKLREALQNETMTLRQQINAHISANGPISFGFDYVVSVKPSQK